MSNDFQKNIYSKIVDSMSNYFVDNHDTYRFGENTDLKRLSLKDFIKYKYIFPRLIPKNKTLHYVKQTSDFLDVYGERLENFHDLLIEEGSKKLLVDLIAYRLLGETKVKLSTNTPKLWEMIKESFKYADKNDYINLNFLNWKLYKTNFSWYNVPVEMYALPQIMVYYEFLGHYSYISSTGKKIAVEENDVVLDCGGCYGDTAILFAHKTGKNGKVFSFEFIPSNIDIFNKNLELNKHIDNVEIIKHPLWETSDIELYYNDNGPGSNVLPIDFDGSNGSVLTLSIDDFMERNHVERIDFIKMDIESAELPALKGAIKTLTQYKPKLAISIYHSMDEFVNIPKYINELGLGYKFYLGHYTIHAEETVLYAIAE